MVSVFESEFANCPFRRKYWAALGVPVQWEEGSLEEALGRKTAQVLIIDPNETTLSLQKAKRWTFDTVRYQFCDTLWLQESHYWPRVTVFDPLLKFTVSHAKLLDISSWAYITGSNPWTRIAIFLASRLGYKKICVVGDDTQKISQILEDSRRHCFGVQFRSIVSADLTLEPNNGSLLINTEDLKIDDALKENILYLNFLHQPGLIMDLFFHGEESTPLSEVLQSEMKLISGFEMRGVFDFEILVQLGLQKAEFEEEYLKGWGELLGVREESISLQRNTNLSPGDKGPGPS